MRDGLIGYAGAFLRAWEKMLRLPLSEKLHRFSCRNGKIQEAAMFVFSGFAAGIITALAGGIIGIFFNRFAGAIFFALLGVLLFLFHDRGRGDGILSSVISGKLPSEYIPVNLIIPIGLLMLKFALFMRIFYHGNSMLMPLIIAGSFALETAMLMDAGFSPPVLDGSAASRRRYWVVLAVILLLTFFTGRLASAFCAVLFAFFWYYADKKGKRKEITPEYIRAMSAASVWGMLIISALLI